MAPQKSAVLGQNVQTEQVSSQKLQRHQQTAKSRSNNNNNNSSNNKKTKQQPIASNKEQQQAPEQAPLNKNIALGTTNTNGLSKVVDSSGAGKQQEPKSPQVAERKTIKNKQQTNNNNNVPSTDNENLNLTSKSIKIVPVAPSITTSVNKQSQFEDEDNIDAGIELDGSSNSGSSVKDISEDHLKSSSASPVMSSQTSNGVSPNLNTSLNNQQVVNSEPAAVLCTSVSETPKKLSVTKQQLAEARQVIDADEQQLQSKLESKQRKSVDSPGSATSGDKKTSSTITASGDSTATDKSGLYRRKFSSQSSQDGHSASVCKVCEQHVYQMERLLAEKSLYHKQCFRCHQCRIQLRVDNYSSHEGEVYCKIHHRQLFQPQVKLDTDDDSNSVANSSKYHLGLSHLLMLHVIVAFHRMFVWFDGSN